MARYTMIYITNIASVFKRLRLTANSGQPVLRERRRSSNELFQRSRNALPPNMQEPQRKKEKEGDVKDRYVFMRGI